MDRFTKENVASNQTDDLEKLRVFCQLIQYGNKANEVSDGFGKLLAWLENDNGIKSLDGGHFVEIEEERKILLVTLKLAIENNIRNETTMKDSRVAGNSFISMISIGFAISTFAENLVKNSEHTKKSLILLRNLLKGKLIRKENQEEAVLTIQEIIDNTPTASQIAYDLNGYLLKVASYSLNEEALYQRLEQGWQKNQTELTKRYQKMLNFNEDSSLKLEEIEKQITESEVDNKMFRKAIDETSDRISSLIQQLRKKSSESDFLHTQMSIVDGTAAEMLKCKNYTDSYLRDQEHALQQKQKNFIDLLKTIDDKLESNFNHQRILLSKNQNFYKAIEELNHCYSQFKLNENQILKTYNITGSLDLESEHVDSPYNSKNEENRHDSKEYIEDKNESLTIENEDLKEQNAKLKKETDALRKNLKDSNTLESIIESKIKEGARYVEEIRNLSEEINKLKSEIHNLLRTNEHLKEKNKNLSTLNNKVKIIYSENKELLDENDALQNEVGSLNEKLNQMDKNKVSCEKFKKLQYENEEIHEKIKIANDKYLELKLSKSPRVIHIDCSTSSILKTSSHEKKEEDSFREEDSFKEELLKSVQNEKERNDLLQKSLKRSENIFKKMADIYTKLSLSKLNPNVSYTLNIHHDDDNSSFSIKNISFTSPEINLLKLKENSSTDASSEEENLIEDLSSMLYQSYKKIDFFKMKFKAIKRKHEEEAAKYNEMHSNFVVLADCLKELNLQRCDENESYVLKLKKGKDFSSIVLNGTRLMFFKKFFNSIDDAIAIKKSLEENCPDASGNKLIKCVLNIKKEQEATDQPQDLQHLLRVLQRENQYLVSSIKKLKKECLYFKKKKLELEKDQNNSELTKNNPLFHYGEEEEDDEIVSLKEAFNLSEANCIFLDKKNLSLEKQLQELQSVFEQLRCDRYDVLEQNECLVNEVREKNEEVHNEKQTNADLKREIEYLEKELEYLKKNFNQNEKARCDQKEDEKSCVKIHTEPEKLSERYKLDLELLLREKRAFLQEIESLRASLHYIQIEKKFLQEQLNKQALREISKSKECKKSVETPIESNVFLEEHHEDVTRVVGLVVRFKKLQKYSEKLKNHLTKTKDELAEIKNQFRAAQVQLEAFKTSNETLQKKYNDLEDVHRQWRPAITRKESLNNIEERIRCFESKCYGSELLNDYEVIKEEVNALACENEEIRQSCNALIKRNSFLRKESFATENKENQIQILTQRLNSLENENSILKLEASKTPKNIRKIAFSRKVSEHLSLLDYQDPSLKDVFIPHISVKYTQTESNGSSFDNAKLQSIQCEELKNVVVELTKRNTMIRTKLSKQEKESEELKVLNNKLRVKINHYVNSKIKENGTCSDCNHTNSGNGTHQSFSLHKEILSEYEKTELEEINKNFKYENKVLKEELEKAEKMQRELKKEIQVLIVKKNEQEKTNNELLLIFEEIKGVEFVDSLSIKLNTYVVNRNTTNTKNTDELAKKQDTLIPRPQNKDASELESKYFAATKKNKEYECTIEILERQILQLSRSILSEGSSEKQDTLKDLRKLKDLQSNSGENIEKSNEGNSSCINNDDKTWSAGDVFDLPDDKFTELEETYDNYQSCIKDGELVSVVEDLFKKYTYSNSAFNVSLVVSENKDDVNYDDNNETTMNLVVKRSEVETAVKVGEIQRFRAKEHLEKTLDLREEQLEKCRLTIEELNDRIREKINEIDHLKQDNEKKYKMYFHAQNKYEESISLLNKKIADSEVMKNSTEEATNTTEKKMCESHIKTLSLKNQTLEEKLDFALQKETALLLKVDELQKELGIQKNLTFELKRKLGESFNYHPKDLRFSLKPITADTCPIYQAESHLNGKLKTGKPEGVTSMVNLKMENKQDIASNTLSEVSDVESNSEEMSNDFVSKLKTKLKLVREKIREKNKLIRSQNDEIDLLLDDLAIKNELIEQLRQELASAESAYSFKG